VEFWPGIDLSGISTLNITPPKAWVPALAVAWRATLERKTAVFFGGDARLWGQSQTDGA
jgi:hypothetical protein